MNIVLIPGAWMGPWVWEPVTRGLRGLGHQVYPVALTGLDASEVDVSGVGLETHINDVLKALEEGDLRDVVIVGHTSTGALAGIVADRVPERVIHTVFVDTFLPHNGESLLEAFPPGLREDELRLIEENNGRWPIPDATVVADGQDLTTDEAEWLVKRFVGHPGRVLTDPVTLKQPLSQQRVTYIVCEREHIGGNLADDIEAMRAQPSWTFRTLDTGLWPMLSAPDQFIALLDDVASKSGPPTD